MRVGIYLGRHAGNGGGIGIFAKTFVRESLLLLGRNGFESHQLIFYGDLSLLDPASIAELQEHGTRFVTLFANIEEVAQDKAQPKALFRRLSVFGGRHLQSILDQLVVAYLAHRDRVEVLHSLANCGLAFSRRTQVITVHDLFQAWPVDEGAAALPQTIRRRLLQLCYRMLFARQFRVAAHVITDSVAGAREIYRRYGYDLARITVIPLGLDPTFLSFWQDSVGRRGAGIDSSFLERHKLEPGYIVVQASCDPRKNLHRTLKAWLALSQDYRRRAQLVLLGDAKAQAAAKEILASAGDTQVRFLSWLPREEIPVLYLHAGVLLLSTLAEGFGLPTIEALALGTSVVTGPLEVLSGGAPGQERVFLCDPRVESTITEALIKAIDARNEPSVSPTTPKLSVRPGRNGTPRPRSLGDAVCESFSVYKQLAVRYNRRA